MTLAPSTLTIHVNAPPTDSTVEQLLNQINQTYDLFTLSLKQIQDDQIIVHMTDNLKKHNIESYEQLVTHLQSSLQDMIELDWIESQFEKTQTTYS